jgi:uncharacterized cupredoxin-like copper-binding protein
MSTLTPRQLLACAAATLLLAGGSTVAAAAASGAFNDTSCATPRLSGAVVRVTDIDMAHMPMGMMGGWPGMMRLLARPTTLHAGTVSFLVRNAGSRAHELVVLPLPGGTPAGARHAGVDGRVDESGSLGEASRSCGAGTGEGIKAGATGWVTLNLAAGRYELICNLKNHYASGMFSELDVG